jgi:Ca2+-binding RTX toxin-like protein
MNSDGSGVAPLTNSAGNKRAPAFSPDGQLVVFNKPSVLDVLTVGSSGQGVETNLTSTPSPVREEAPVWQSIFSCGGRQATIVGTDSGEKLKGTKGQDVIVGNGGKDTIKGLGGRDRLCGGNGRDRIAGGKGRKDLCRGQQGKDFGGKGCEKGKL